MLKRKVYSKLLEWKSDPGHKALVIRGQRQVGKTFIVREFARNEYRHFVEVNLSLDEDVKVAFKGNLRVDDIVRRLSAFHDPSDFVPGETLIFFDEVQDCPSAWSSLKDFTEDGRYDVIASGSRLGIEMNIERTGQQKLLPTGYQHFVEMKVLDFEEFLWANGIQESQISEVIQDLKARRDVDLALHTRFTSLFREYLVTGGMPAVVDEYVRSRDVSRCHAILEDILTTCHQDINRYNVGIDKVKAAECFDSIPAQLSQTNKKFMYSRIECEGSRRSAEKFMSNLLWIRYAGLGIACHALSQPSSPLVGNRVPDVFRLYLSDTGLLLHQYGLSAVAAVWKGEYGFNCGAVVENQVAVSLDSCGYKLYYYRKNSGVGKMELDFVIETFQGLMVVEVRSGKTRDAPSIRKVPRFFKVDKRVMLEDSQYHVDDDGLEHLPLYSSAFFDRIWSMDP